MKNKKGQTIYFEEIYFPCEFRTKILTFVCPAMCMIATMIQKHMPVTMKVIATGWVQNEVHLQWGHQSLN